MKSLKNQKGYTLAKLVTVIVAGFVILLGVSALALLVIALFRLVFM